MAQDRLSAPDGIWYCPSAAATMESPVIRHGSVGADEHHNSYDSNRVTRHGSGGAGDHHNSFVSNRVTHRVLLL